MNNFPFKLGKKKPVYDKRDLQFSQYVDISAVLPQIPASFGHEKLINQWNVLGNDNFGDCVFAGSAHETMLWNKEANKTINFTDASVLSDYSAVTGFNPSDPNTDQGTDVRTALQYRQNIGIIDANGVRHKLGAYVALEPGNVDHVKAAMYLFGAVGIGINFPNSAMDQFNAGKVWSVVHGAQIEGGHYIPIIAIRNRRWECVTWGAIQPMTLSFYRKYSDEAWGILSEEMLTNGKSPEGFDLAALHADLQAVRNGH